MAKTIAEQIAEHPDFDEIVSKLASDIDTQIIFEWLESRYVKSGDKGLIFHPRQLDTFKKEYLNFYNIVRQHTLQVASSKGENATNVKIDNMLSKNQAYRKKLEMIVDNKIDTNKLIAETNVRIEHLTGLIYDKLMEDPENMLDPKLAKLWLEAIDKQGTWIDRFDKKQAAEVVTVSNQNISIEIVEKYTSALRNAIVKILSRMDMESSMELISEINAEIAKVKPDEAMAAANVEYSLSEVKTAHDAVSAKLLGIASDANV
jgi:hypothetical protein